jgi:hypothetical protein
MGQPERQYRYRKGPWDDELTRIRWEENIVFSPPEACYVYAIVAQDTTKDYAPGDILPNMAIVLPDEDNPESNETLVNSLRARYQKHLEAEIINARSGLIL